MIKHTNYAHHHESNTLTLDAEWSAKWAAGDREAVKDLAARCAMATARDCRVKASDGTLLHGAHFTHPALVWLKARGIRVEPSDGPALTPLSST